MRALGRLESVAPQLTARLFGAALLAELRESGGCTDSPLLQFTHNEPAINIYTAEGSFSPHKDLQAITLLMPLSDPTEFVGGGTAFWASSPDPPGGASQDAAEREPALEFAPPVGTALLFCGGLLHAGLPVTAGQRAVLVASFSPRGTAADQHTSGQELGALQQLYRPIEG